MCHDSTNCDCENIFYSEGEVIGRLQFTGLHDKNGKEIYDGDIVNKQYFNFSVYDGIGVVQICEGSDSDGYHHGKWLGWMAGESSLLDVHSECEVIGNIYENQELLKETK